LSTLKLHTKPLNCVRFSPDGTKLCSSGDDGLLILWELDTAPPQTTGLVDEDLVDNKERWRTVRSFA
jgi:WD40 repeat protein